jgi:hypothetical protein
MSEINELLKDLNGRLNKDGRDYKKFLTLLKQSKTKELVKFIKTNPKSLKLCFDVYCGFPKFKNSGVSKQFISQELSLLAPFGGLSSTERYLLSIANAKKATPFEINEKLIDINPWNNEIIWNRTKTKILVISAMKIDSLQWYLSDESIRKVNSGTSKRLMLTNEDIQLLNTLTPKNQNFPNYTHKLRENNVSWVTVSPEVQFFLNEKKEKFNTESLRVRMTEWLGLFPENDDKLKGQYRVLVEQWIDPKDLFRPSIDPEIMDKDSLPEDIDIQMEPFKDMAKNTRFDILNDNKISPYQKKSYRNWYKEHRYPKWYSIEKNGKYQGQWAMPWTRLGYTLDYSEEAFNSFETGKHFGASEFCIKPDTKVEIERVISLQIYSHYKYRRMYTSIIRKNFKTDIEKNLNVMKRPQLTNMTRDETLEEISKSYNAHINVIKLVEKGKKYTNEDVLFKEFDVIRENIKTIKKMLESL